MIFFRRTPSYFVALIAGVAAIPGAWAVPTIADYGNLPTNSMVAISPSGNAVALRTTSGGSDQVIVVSLEEGKVLQRTDVSSVLPRRMYFVSDKELVLVASELKRMLGFREEFDVSTAFSMHVDSGDIRQLLTPGDVIYKGQSGLGRIVGISSDRQHLYMPAYVAKTPTDRNPDLNLLKVEIESPRRPSIFLKNKRDAIDFFVGTDDRLLAIETYNNNSNLHRVLVERDGDWVAIFEDEAEVMNVSFEGLTAGQDALVMLTNNPETGRVAYSALSLEDGAISENLFGRTDADVERVLKDINRIARGVMYAGLRPTYDFFDPDVDRRVREIQGLFGGDSVWLVDWSDDWKHLVVYVEGASTSGDYYLFSQGAEPRFLTAARPNIGAEHVNPIAVVTLAARDGLDIPTILTIPLESVESPQHLPAIMLPHGGPESYDRFEFDWLAQAFASQGYLVIQPQFRGSAGFGAAHLAAGYGEWGRKMQDDLTDTLAALVAEQVVDPSRVCIVGSSYGGYAALAGGAFTPDVYGCVVSLNGVSDLPGMLAFERRKYGRTHWVVSYFENFMVPGEATKDKLDAISPVNFADKFTAPVLLIHGENDETVPFDQSRDMQKKLRSAGADVRLVKLKDENHNLMTAENRLASLEEMIAFVNRHIGAD